MDDPLDDLLRGWKGIEPVPDLERRVWAELSRDEERVRPAPGNGYSFVLAAAAALLLGCGMGFVIGRMGGSEGLDHRGAVRYALDRPGSITGNYALLARGGMP